MKSQESPEINPYTPPTTFTEEPYTEHLEKNGYAHLNELLANDQFKSPLFCAKLGIPISPEEVQNLKATSVTRVNRFSLKITKIISILTLLTCGITYYFIRNTNVPITFSLVPISCQHLLHKDHKISFYFSDKYHQQRKRKIKLSAISLILLFIFVASISLTYDYKLLHLGLIIPPFLLISSLAIYFVSSRRISSQNKTGDYYHIKGLHTDFLKTLPAFPLAIQSNASCEKDETTDLDTPQKIE